LIDSDNIRTLGTRKREVCDLSVCKMTTHQMTNGDEINLRVIIHILLLD